MSQTGNYDQFNAYYFAGRIFRNFFTAMNASFAAFMLLVFLAFSGVSSNGFPGWKDSLFIISLLAVSAFVYASVFNFFFFIGRLIASFFTRIEKLWSLSIPGVYLFIIFAEPIYAFLAGENSGNSLTIFFYVYIIASIAVAIPILYIFPVFKGYNATFLLVAAIIARIVHYPLFQLRFFGGSELFIYSHSLLVILSVIIFMTLHIRYKLYLSPGYERVDVPLHIFIIPVIILIIPLVFFIYKEYFRNTIALMIPDDAEIQFQVTMFYSIYSILILVLNLQWFLTVLIISLRKNRNEETLSVFPTSLIFLAEFAFVIYSIPVLSSGNKIDGRFVEASYILNLGLSSIGSSFDFDEDSNSSFPGHDPNDKDSCLRNGISIDYCKKSSKEENKISEASTNVPFLTVVTVGTDLSQKNLNDSLSAEKFSADNIMYAARRIPGIRTAFFTQKTFLLPTNRASNNLIAINQGLNGMEEYNGSFQHSIYSKLSMMGYRTICVMHYSEDEYNSQLASRDPGSGCQVYEVNPVLPKLNNPEHKDGLSHFTDTSLRILSRYRESRNVLWIHYDDKQKPARGEDIYYLLTRLLTAGDVIVAQLSGSKRLTGEIYRFSSNPSVFQVNKTVLKEKEILYTEILRGVGLHRSGVTYRMKIEPMVGVIYDDDYRNIHQPLFHHIKENDRLKSDLPPITFSKHDRSIVIYDGIRGILWNEVP